MSPTCDNPDEEGTAAPLPPVVRYAPLGIRLPSIDGVERLSCFKRWIPPCACAEEQ